MTARCPLERRRGPLRGSSSLTWKVAGGVVADGVAMCWAQSWCEGGGSDSRKLETRPYLQGETPASGRRRLKQNAPGSFSAGVTARVRPKPATPTTFSPESMSSQLPPRPSFGLKRSRLPSSLRALRSVFSFVSKHEEPAQHSGLKRSRCVCG